MLRRLAKRTGAAFTATTAILCGYAAYDEGTARSLKFCAQLVPIKAKYIYADLSGADDTQRETLHTECAPRVLALVLSMGGYYVKAAQTLVGGGFMPGPYEEAFAVLLDDCPSKDFPTIRGIVETELRAPLESKFSEFCQNSVAAASIGQVHFATVKETGERVVVKVQYPEVERFFRVDFGVLKTLIKLGGFGDQAEEVIDQISATFDNEFDYAREAAFLEEAADNLANSPFASAAIIPRPIYSLCTRKVLTMQRVKGTPIRAYIHAMLADLAAEKGLTAKQLVDALKKEVEDDPQKLREMLTAKPVSAVVFDAAIAWVKIRDCVMNAARWVLRREMVWTKAPLNGARIANTLFNIHGYQIFQDGLFNSDPHAGNVIVCEDGRIGLVDYGAACRLTEAERAAFADLIIALADGDDQGAVRAFAECGFKSEKMNPHFILAYATVCFHRGFHMEDLERLNLPTDPAVFDFEMAKIDKFEKWPGHLVMLQRCAMVLQGLAAETGAGSVSISKLWRKQAEDYRKMRPKVV